MTPLLVANCDSGFFQIICTSIKDRGFAGSDVLGQVTQQLLQGIVVFAVVIGVSRFLRGLTIRGIQRTGADAQLRTLVNNVFMMTTLTVAILAGLTAGGLSISVLLTVAGLGSLAIGLAFQDLLRNILAGIFLLIERPFRIGDWITVGEWSGSVQTIQLRTTALRTADGKLAILPNLTAFTGTVVNSTAYDVRQFTVAVRLLAGADLERAMATVRRVVEGHDAVLKEPPLFIQPRLDADGGVTLLARYWLQYRSTDPDAVSAVLVTALYDALGPWPQPQAAPGAAVPPGTPAEQAPPAG
ncbi:MAG TPA: mechanosensitive ion channel family protein [Candidatus Dormibacteraeota bacterium]|jgi:small-conductance mechanosensitive channel|nr:mechanosensitive ion channel family protein [Candidatus Dormibacteraeota bacterium]